MVHIAERQNTICRNLFMVTQVLKEIHKIQRDKGEYNMKKRICLGFLMGIIMAAFMVMPVFAGQWIQETQGWWYLNDNGKYMSEGWQWIDGRCYYFNKDGYCLLNTVTPDGYIVDESGAWTVDGTVQIQNQETNQWVDTFFADDGQVITVLSADSQGVLLSFSGYSEEGTYLDTKLLPYRNGNKTEVASNYYYEGRLISETVYFLTDKGIEVIVLPSGGWKSGVYIRQ